MALSRGTRLGQYEIVDALGAGGMGEVYRAQDTKLGRAVAIKVLPEAFLFDPDRIARFEREARVLASLNHPHIAALYGMEESGGQHFLVMELVEGQTIADRLRRGPLRVEDTLQIALQITDALEAAHEKGVVHRDLKPANVKITPDEQVKVLDFGLAKLGAGGPGRAGGPGEAGGASDGNLTASPTLSMLATQAGLILGTAAYMSPEQAQGLPVDQRSDVFSFGAMLYEMLTGRQVFQGETGATILASVLIREPDLNALPPNLNPRLVDLLRRCLEKNPKKRWHAVGDLRVELETIATAPHKVPPAMTRAEPLTPLWKRAVPVLVTALVVAGLTSAAWWYVRPSTPPLTVTRFPFTLPEGQNFTNTGRQIVDIAPDGSQMVYVANQRLYLRSLSEVEARPIAGTDSSGTAVLNPVFSPDGRSIAFLSVGDQALLKRIAVTGGAALTICPIGAVGVFGVSWTPDSILFGQQNKGIMRVSPDGGKPEVVVSVKSGEWADGPHMLPDGQTVLFTLAEGAGDERWDKARIVVQSLKSGERKTLIEGGSDARYLPTGHLVYARGGVLFAIPFDLRRLQVSGGPVPIVEGVRRAVATGTAQFSVAANGSLIYVPGPVSTSTGLFKLAFVDRKGVTEALKLPPVAYDHPRVAPDGKRIAFAADDGKDAAVWISDLSGATSMSRITFGGKNRFPIWSADGQRIAFQSDREGDLGIFWQRADGTGTAERLTKADKDASHIPESWSPKGDVFSFRVTKGTNNSVWMFSLRDKKSAPFGGIQSSVPTDSVFSPDGRWVAYESGTGRGTGVVYVQPFPATGATYQVPVLEAGGYRHPLWSPDGKELFFMIGGDSRMKVAGVTTRPGFVLGNPAPVPRPLFRDSLTDVARPWDITPDGQRFVVTTGVGAAGQAESGMAVVQQIQVVLNWFEELKQRVPTK